MTVVAKAELAQSYIAHPQVAFLLVSKEIAPLRLSDGQQKIVSTLNIECRTRNFEPSKVIWVDQICFLLRYSAVPCSAVQNIYAWNNYFFIRSHAV